MGHICEKKWEILTPKPMDINNLIIFIVTPKNNGFTGLHNYSGQCLLSEVYLMYIWKLTLFPCDDLFCVQEHIFIVLIIT